MSLATQQTSREAFERIRDGISSKMRRRIYSALLDHGMMTAGELQHMMPTLRLNSVSTRLSEMRKLGLVREEEPRECRITGFKAVPYVATIPMGNEELNVKRRRTRKEIQVKVDELLAKYNDGDGFNCSFAKGAASALNWVLCHHHMDLMELASYNA